MEMYLRRETPHRSEFVAGAGDALRAGFACLDSRKGRGRSTGKDVFFD
jgi:hypothetical protein